MENESWKVVIKRIFFITIVGLALTALAGCGISQGPYRHGYNGRNYRNNADNYRDVSGYSGNLSATPGYNHDNRGYGAMMGYDPDRSGYCR
jgi:hypothetical protein